MGLCHCSLSAWHSPVPLTAPGDSRHCLKAQEGLNAAQQNADWVCRQPRWDCVSVCLGSAWLWASKALATWV